MHKPKRKASKTQAKTQAIDFDKSFTFPILPFMPSTAKTVHLVLVRDSRRAVSVHEDHETARQEVKDLALIDPETVHIVETWYVLPKGHSLIATSHPAKPRSN